jgi:hypothetical protein
LNHAVNFYDLKSNAARKAGSMGKERTKEMLFWTKEEYMKFIEAVADKPISFYASEYLRQALVDKVRVRMGINESVLVFGYAKMHQNKSKNISIISKAIIKYANDNNEESLDVLDNFKNFDNLNKNKQTEYINIIKPLINQYGQSAIFFIEEHYSEIKDEIKKRD